MGWVFPTTISSRCADARAGILPDSRQLSGRNRGQEISVAPRGRTQWVRNAEAAGEIGLKKGSARQQFRLRPLAGDEKSADLESPFPIPSNVRSSATSRFPPVPRSRPSPSWLRPTRRSSSRSSSRTWKILLLGIRLAAGWLARSEPTGFYSSTLSSSFFRPQSAEACTKARIKGWGMAGLGRKLHGTRWPRRTGGWAIRWRGSLTAGHAPPPESRPRSKPTRSPGWTS